MARNQKEEQEHRNLFLKPQLPLHHAAEQAAGQTTDPGPEAQMFVTADQFAGISSTNDGNVQTARRNYH